MAAPTPRNEAADAAEAMAGNGVEIHTGRLTLRRRVVRCKGVAIPVTSARAGTLREGYAAIRTDPSRSKPILTHCVLVERHSTADLVRLGQPTLLLGSHQQILRRILLRETVFFPLKGL